MSRGYRKNGHIPETIRRSRAIFGRPSNVESASANLWSDIYEVHGLRSDCTDDDIIRAFDLYPDHKLQLVTDQELAPMPIPFGSVSDFGLSTGPAFGNEHQQPKNRKRNVGTDGGEGRASKRAKRDPWQAPWYPSCEHDNVEGMQYGTLPAPLFGRQGSALEWLCRQDLDFPLNAKYDPRIARGVREACEYTARSRKYRRRNPLADRIGKEMPSGSRRGSTYWKLPRVRRGKGRWGAKTIRASALGKVRVARNDPHLEKREEELTVHQWGGGNIMGQTVGRVKHNYDPLYNGKKCYDDKKGAQVILSDVGHVNSENLGLGKMDSVIDHIDKLVEQGCRVIYKCSILDAIEGTHTIVGKARFHNDEVICDTHAPISESINPIPLMVKANHIRNLLHKGWLLQMCEDMDIDLVNECWQCNWEILSDHMELPPLEVVEDWPAVSKRSVGWTPDPPEALDHHMELMTMRQNRTVQKELYRMNLLNMSKGKMYGLLDRYTAAEIAGEYNYQLMTNEE